MYSSILKNNLFHYVRQYLGARTTEKVKKKTIEIMYSWQIGLPHEPKVKEAYEMLKKQGESFIEI